jgi:asparagine synthase (glutamine-hydrolysing)
MPGIAGVFGAAPSGSDETAQMAACMSHGLSFTSGSFGDRALGCHAATASHRESFSDGMPLWNAARDVCLLFSGEDFTDAAELSELRRKGRPAEVGVPGYLISMYEEYGPSFVTRLNGWFSGVLVDLRKKLAILFNDRYGLNRIYWHQTDRGLYFASEAKALLAIFPDLRRLDPAAVAETVSFGCVLRNRSLFRGLSLLPPGSAWTFHEGTHLEKQTYFTPMEWEQQSPLDGESFYEELRGRFGRLMQRYFRGPGPLAMSLTGGLDSRMIMAWARQPAGTLPCYSFGGTYRDCHDVRIGLRVAKSSGQIHTTIEVGAAFLADFPTLAARTVYLSDGTMDVSGATELYVNRFAREIAPVRLTGNYGSEIIRAYVAFRPRKMAPDLFDTDFQRHFDQAAETYREERKGHNVSFIAFKQVPYHHYSRLSVERSLLTLRSPFLDNDLVRLMYRAPPSSLQSKDLSLRLVHDGDPALALIPTDRGILYGGSALANRLRSNFREFTAKAEYAYDYGMPDWLCRLDQLLAPLGIERLFLGQHKFYHFRSWYRHALAPFVKDVLLDRRTFERSCFRPEVLKHLVDEHATGRGNHTLEIHRALTLELTHRELLDRRPDPSRRISHSEAGIERPTREDA